MWWSRRGTGRACGASVASSVCISTAFAQDNWLILVVEDEKFKKGMCVFVRPPGLRPDAEGKERDFWVASIVEIKARDPTRVYALVAWFYWADQLEGAYVVGEEPRDGRRGYHGKDELLASNHLDVCDVRSFAGEAPVAQWDEGDDENDVQTGLYWRQTYDCRTGKLSVCCPLGLEVGAY